MKKIGNWQRVGHNVGRRARWIFFSGVLCSLLLAKVGIAYVTQRADGSVLERLDTNGQELSTLKAKTLSQEKALAVNTQAQHVPPSFGKSHFIVGMSAEETARYSAKSSVKVDNDESVNACDMVCLGVFPQVLFSPHDDVRKALVHLINNEKKSIKVAAYTVTEPKVAEALIAAIKRGVAVSLVVDRSCLDMAAHKIKLLRKAGLEVAVFDGKTHEDGALMHNKFFLFQQNFKNKKLIWTGSANTTKSGYARNHENVIIFEEPTLFARYEKEFTFLTTIAENLKS